MPNTSNLPHPHIYVSGSLPDIIESNLCRILADQRSNLLTKERIEDVAKSIQTRKNPNYETDWPSFSYLYFAANYVKAFLAARTISLPEDRSTFRILDLGCGGGAATIGVISALTSALPAPKDQIFHVVAVDRCTEQLQLFEDVTKPWAASTLPHATIETRHADVLAYLRSHEWSADLVILCYLTTELSAAENSVLRELLRERLRDGKGQALIIESDPGKRGILLELVDGSQRIVGYDEVSLKLPLLKSLNLSLPPKFSSRITRQDILDRYFQAWTYHDTDIIRSIFDDQATYEILGLKTLRGIDEINAYWEHNARTQRNIKCGWTKMSTTPNGLIGTWNATFERVDCGEIRHLSGILQLTIKDDKITELSEAYAQSIEPIPQQSGK